MNLLLLDGPSSPMPGRNINYRGTDRAHPTYCASFPEEHEVNKCFIWFLEEGGESGVVHDVSMAKYYANVLNSCNSDASYEVIEVVDGASSSTSGGRFFGFDISFCYNSSLLPLGFNVFPSLNTLNEPIRELCKLLNRCYKPKLNNFGLFDEYEVATSCRSAMIALQMLCENLYEGDDLDKFNVIGVYRVET